MTNRLIIKQNKTNIIKIIEKGPKGKDLEFHWDGTKLGVRQEGDEEYAYQELAVKEIEEE